MQGPLMQVGSLFPGQAPACPGLQALVAAITETVRTRTRDLNATLNVNQMKMIALTFTAKQSLIRPPCAGKSWQLLGLTE